MRRFGAAALVACMVVAATAAEASEKETIRQTVLAWYHKFNAGEPGALAMCAEHASVIDEFAPFRWTSCADWFRAYDAYASANKITASKVNITRFAHVNVKDGRAYVTGPAVYTYRENGKPRRETALDVLTLEKGADGWRITSAAWFGTNGADAGKDASAVADTAAQFVTLSAPPSPAPIAVVDEFPPFHWVGASAHDDWFSALKALTAAGGVTDMKVTLETPSQLSVNGATAYLAAPSVITSKHNGKTSAEHGAFVFAFEKANDAWHIVSWAWATK